MSFCKSLFSVFLLLVFLVASAEAAKVQVIEADCPSGDLSCKKLRAMATIYLAELGFQPTPDFKVNGVSFSISGPGRNIIRMEKFAPDGIVEYDSTTVVDLDNMDEDLETMITKAFGYVDKIYASDSISEVFFMDPEIIGVNDSLAKFVTRNMEISIEEDLGYNLAEDNRDVTLYTTLIKLKNTYWLGMLRTKGSKVIKAVHRKFMPDEDLEIAIPLLLNKVMSPNVEPTTSDTKVVHTGGTHEESCRAGENAESASGILGGIFVDILCYASDYVGLEIATGAKYLYGDFIPDYHLGFVWGFTDTHSWIWSIDYAGTFSRSKPSRIAFESIHRFSQDKGFFVDIVWGKGNDDKGKRWFWGADLGYNLLATQSKANWLSLILRYDHNFDEDLIAGSRISFNLVYNLRGYFSD